MLSLNRLDKELMKKELTVQRRIQAESIPTRADKERYLYHLSAMTDEEKFALE